MEAQSNNLVETYNCKVASYSIILLPVCSLNT